MPFLTHYAAGSPTKLDIHEEIRGKVPELVTALAIDPESLHKHIHCPFESHQDRHPSFRIDRGGPVRLDRNWQGLSGTLLMDLFHWPTLPVAL